MWKKIRLIIIVIIILIIAFIGFFVYQIYSKPNFNSSKEFVIKKGESVDEIAGHLFVNDLISSPALFKIYLYLRGWSGSMQAGTYMLTPMNIVELSKTFSMGKVDNEITLKFIEGWTIDDMADYLVKQKIIKNKNELIDAVKNDKFRNDYEFLKNINNNNLEGFLFPDTYQVYKDAAIEDIIKKMLDNFQNKLTDAFLTEIKAQGKNLYQIITMASIIENEVQNDKDRKNVAGILWKRLNVNMALQVDSSLKYAIGKKNSPSLTLDELKIDSPYNTYKYRGLPPTPISKPGISAIRAAIYPEKNDYWYYLSNQESNETIFAKDYDEQQKNVEKYLR